MSSKIESGMNTYAGHFDQLINVCSGFGDQYNPTPPGLKIPALNCQLGCVRIAITAVDTALAEYVSTENARQETFGLLLPLSIRVQASAVVLGLPDAIIVHIKEVVRKIHGRRAHALPTIPLEGASEKHISVSQVSFNEQIEHLNQLITLVSSQTDYDPAEEDLTVESLTQLLSSMYTTHHAAMAADAALTAARQERNRKLYDPKTGMMDTALAVKEYVKAVFGASSPQYKEVQHITFHNK
jgi:hypothetical protein